MKQMLYLFMTLLFQQLSHAQAKQLADLEIDGKMHQRWYLCKDMSVLLKPSEAEISNKCYKWYGKPFQGVYAFIKDSYSLSSTPDVTYFYKCERYPDETCGSGTPEAVWYFKVLVIEGIKIWYLRLNNEVMMDQKSNPPFTAPDIETMDEYSDYVIQGDLVGVNLGDFDLRDSIVSLSLTTDIGQIIPGAKMPARTSQFGYMGIIPHVQQDGISKQYNLKIQAKICNFESSVIELIVKRLWIDRFQRIDAPDSKKFMITIDDPIYYQASAVDDCNNYEWNFIKHWKLNSNGLSHLKSGSNLSIKSIEIPDARFTKYDTYGSKFGIVSLSCKYKTSKLNVTSFPIISVRSFPFQIKVQGRYMGNYLSHIFYHKNDLNTTTGSPATSKPNWYYYWTKFVNFHPLCTSTLYSNLKPHAWAITHINEDLKGYTEFFDRSSEDNDILGTKNDKGLHVFNEVIAHESWHYNFYNMLWTTFGPGYVMSSLDLDGDLYPDEFEISQEGRLAGFMVRLYPDYIDKFDPNSSSNGTIYEELRAKVEELNLSGNYNELTKYDRFDWSYDRENKYQGKNWK